MKDGRPLWVALFVTACVLALATAHELSIGADADAAAGAAIARRDWPRAVLEARSAAEAFVPGSPWSERGLRTLAALGRDAEARGDDASALLAYGAMRTAVLETRSVWTSRSVWRQAADDGLARVADARRDAVTPGIPGPAMRLALRADDAPSDGWLAVLAGSSVAMVLGLARLALGRREGPTVPVARVATIAGFVGYAVAVLVQARRG